MILEFNEIILQFAALAARDLLLLLGETRGFLFCLDGWQIYAASLRFRRCVSAASLHRWEVYEVHCMRLH